MFSIKQRLIHYMLKFVHVYHNNRVYKVSYQHDHYTLAPTNSSRAFLLLVDKFACFDAYFSGEGEEPMTALDAERLAQGKRTKLT